MFVSPPHQIHLLEPNPQGDGIGRQGLWRGSGPEGEPSGVGLGHTEKVPMRSLSLSLPFAETVSKGCP